MILYLYSLVVYYLILALLNFSNLSNIYLVNILVILQLISLLILIFMRKPEIFTVMMAGIVFRVILMYFDLYGRNIFVLPNSGQDSEGFYASAVAVSQNLKLLSDNIYGGYYSKILGVLFKITGNYRVIGHHLNLFLGIVIMLILYRFLKKTNLQTSIPKHLILLFVFFPQSLIFSSVLMRENIIVLCSLVSVIFMYKWFSSNKNKYIVLSLFMVYFSSLFHSAMIVLAGAQMFALAFYNSKIKKMDYSFKKQITFILLSFVALVVFLQIVPKLKKFDQLESVESLYTIATQGRGSAEYLKGLRVNTLWDFVLYLPIKMFYFIASPIPWDWRGVQDLLVFVFDSFFYINVMLKAIKYRRINSNPYILFISLYLLIFVIVFSVGVSNSGTAMRHRHKIFPVSIIYLLLINDFKNKNSL